VDFKFIQPFSARESFRKTVTSSIEDYLEGSEFAINIDIA